METATTPAPSTPTNPNAVEVIGTVDRFKCQRDNFCTGTIMVDECKVGPVSVQARRTLDFKAFASLDGDRQYQFIGEWVNDPRWGWQVVVQSAQIVVPTDPEGLRVYLANNPQMKNVGPKRARLLAENFFDSWEHSLQNEPDRMADVAKCPLEVIENIREVWKTECTFRDLAIYLSSFGLSNAQVSKLIDNLGNNAATLLAQNPYLIIGEIDGYGFKRVDEITLKLGIKKDDDVRIQAGIMDVVKQEHNGAGNCWLTREDLISKSNRLLCLDRQDQDGLIWKTFEFLESEGELVQSETSIDGIRKSILVGLARAYRAESEIFSFLTTRQYIPLVSDHEQATALVVEHGSEMLNEEQRLAVVRALNTGMSVITGGAGVGKTFTITSLVRVAEALGKNVSLAAPTGKAARRMEEVIGRPSQTIHRLLEYNPMLGGFTINERNPLTCDLLIIDETSMLDIYLAVRLLRACTEETAVVFVGDHQQLPPVGAGNVLRDIIERTMCPISHLSKVIRQAGTLKKNSNAILEGKVQPTAMSEATIGQSADGKGLMPWVVVGRKEAETTLEAVESMVGSKSVGVAKYGFDPIRDVQILTPQKKGTLGVKNLNLFLQDLMQRNILGNPIPPADSNDRKKFYPGDKVIQTRNNYTTGIMNGELGYVVSVDDGAESIRNKDGITVLWENSQQTFLRKGTEEYRQVELAYALTIHKVQGSEFPIVVVILHKEHSYMLDRCLLYTAVTRARKVAMLLGDPWAINRCAEVVKSDKRRTFLSLGMPPAKTLNTDDFDFAF